MGNKKVILTGLTRWSRQTGLSTRFSHKLPKADLNGKSDLRHCLSARRSLVQNEPQHEQSGHNNEGAPKRSRRRPTRDFLMTQFNGEGKVLQCLTLQCRGQSIVAAAAALLRRYGPARSLVTGCALMPTTDLPWWTTGLRMATWSVELSFCRPRETQRSKGNGNGFRPVNLLRMCWRAQSSPIG